MTFFLRQELDESHVADLVEAHQGGIVEHAVGQAALHYRPRAFDYVKVRQGVTILVDQHSRAAPLPSRPENRHH